MSVITTSELHHAFSDFVLHLRGRSIETELEIDNVSARVALIEETGGVGGEAEALRSHILAPEPHNAYDNDLPNLSVIFDNLIA